jgi:hypothetical protein
MAIVDKINEFLSSNEGIKNDHLKYEISKLAEWSFQRQFMTEQEDDKPYSLRLSSAGKCPRQLAYGYHGFEKKGKEMDGRGRIVFFQGDMVELMTMALAKIAGCKIMATGFNQLSVELPITLGEPEEVIYIKGHPDGILIDDETYLVECKSMSSYSYDSFEKGDIDDTYLAQINLYMLALNLRKCVIIAINKNNGVMNERIINYDDKIARETKDNLVKVIVSTPEELPKARYEPNDKGFYPWNCLYCSWWGLCHPVAERVLVGSSYKLKEKQQPKLLKKEVVK